MKYELWINTQDKPLQVSYGYPQQMSRGEIWILYGGGYYEWLAEYGYAHKLSFDIEVKADLLQIGRMHNIDTESSPIEIKKGTWQSSGTLGILASYQATNLKSLKLTLDGLFDVVVDGKKVATNQQAYSWPPFPIGWVISGAITGLLAAVVLTRKRVRG